MKEDNPARDASMRQLGLRKFAIGLNTTVAIVLALLLFVSVNYLSFRHYYRYDVSRDQFYSLSEKTRSILGGLTNQIDIIVMMQQVREHEFDNYRDVDNVLRQYEYASPHINVVRVDPHKNLARVEELANKYEIEEINVVVVDNNGRRRYLKPEDLFEFDRQAQQYGGRPVKVAFRGEQALSSAIQNITQGSVPVVYFLQGHGERDPQSFDRYAGYSAMAQLIAKESIQSKTLVFGDKQRVPEDCDALIIAGPTKRLSQPEVDLIRMYVERNGRLLVALDPMTDVGLAPLLEEWGVQIANDVVFDQARSLTGRELILREQDFGPHPIVQKLGQTAIVLHLPRSIRAVASARSQAEDPADRPHVTPLLFSSAGGWAESDIEESPMKFDPDRDVPGPVSLAVAVEKGPVPGIDVQIRPTRLVIFGDSDFASNAGLTGSNSDLFINSLNWLVEREELLAIAPKSSSENRLVMTQSQMMFLFLVSVIGMPGIVAVVGGMVWYRRRT